MNDAAANTHPEPDPWARHREVERAVRVHVPVPRQAHTFAMLAKKSVFRAQDMLHDVEDEKLARKMERRLAKVRTELEALDRDVRRAGGA